MISDFDLHVYVPVLTDEHHTHTDMDTDTYRHICTQRHTDRHTHTHEKNIPCMVVYTFNASTQGAEGSGSL